MLAHDWSVGYRVNFATRIASITWAIARVFPLSLAGPNGDRERWLLPSVRCFRGWDRVVRHQVKVVKTERSGVDSNTSFSDWKEDSIAFRACLSMYL